MNESKKLQKKVEPKSKLTLNRETLRTVSDSELQLLDGVVGGTGPVSVGTYFPSSQCANEDQKVE